MSRYVRLRLIWRSHDEIWHSQTNCIKIVQIKIDAQKFGANIRNLMRKIGYVELRDPRSQKVGYVRRLRHGFYPRFHIKPYRDEEGNLILDLHYDTAKPMHMRGTTRVEESGEVVELEVLRIKSLLQ